MNSFSTSFGARALLLFGSRHYLCMAPCWEGIEGSDLSYSREAAGEGRGREAGGEGKGR